MASREEETFESYDNAFCESIVRTLVQEPDFCITVAAPHLSPTLFENGIHRWFAETIFAFVDRHANVPTPSAMKIEAERAFMTGRLVRKRDKGLVDAMLAKLKKPVKDCSFVKDELFKYIKHQSFKRMVMDGVKLLKEGRYDEIDKEMQVVLDVQAAADGGLGSFLVSDRKNRFKRRKSYTPDGIPTGFEFDRYMKGGGPRRKQLAAYVAPPSGGKTTSLIQTGKQGILLAQMQVLHITLELAEEIIVDRYDACFTGIKQEDLEQGGNPLKVRRFMRDLGRDLQGEPLVIKEFPALSVNVRHIENYIKQLERRGFYPGIVIVDYADLILPLEGYTGDSYEDAGNVYIQLRAMAQKLDVLVWTAGQGNRNSLGKKILTMKELADSFKKAMHSDVLVALCQTDEEQQRHTGRYYIMKNRNGPAALECPIKTDWSRSQVRNRT